MDIHIAYNVDLSNARWGVSKKQRQPLLHKTTLHHTRLNRAISRSDSHRPLSPHIHHPQPETEHLKPRPWSMDRSQCKEQEQEQGDGAGCGHSNPSGAAVWSVCTLNDHDLDGHLLQTSLQCPRAALGRSSGSSSKIEAFLSTVVEPLFRQIATDSAY